jgi:hypothetical protein
MFGTTRIVLNSLLMLSLALGPTRAQTQHSPDPPDYQIAFWYRRSDPLNTFRHQVYDVRKGQYTVAVEQWLRTMQAHHPDYIAYVKPLRLKQDRGQTEEKQLATAILSENLEKGGPNGGFGVRDPYGIFGGSNLGALLTPAAVPERPRPELRDEVSRYSRGYGFIDSPGANRPPWFLASPSQSPQSLPGPFPFPYVRPHP